jgi:hypothetical protein
MRTTDKKGECHEQIGRCPLGLNHLPQVEWAPKEAAKRKRGGFNLQEKHMHKKQVESVTEIFNLIKNHPTTYEILVSYDEHLHTLTFTLRVKDSMQPELIATLPIDHLKGWRQIEEVMSVIVAVSGLSMVAKSPKQDRTYRASYILEAQ